MREALRWARRAIDGDHELPPKPVSDEEQTVDRKRPATTHDAPTARTKLEETLPRLSTDDEPTVMRMSVSPSKRTDPYGGAAPEPTRAADGPATVRDAHAPESGAASGGPVFSLTQKKPPESAPPTRRVSSENPIDSSVLTSAPMLSSYKKAEAFKRTEATTKPEPPPWRPWPFFTAIWTTDGPALSTAPITAVE